MAEQEHNPLASLNLGGLTKLEVQTQEKGVQRADLNDAVDGAVAQRGSSTVKADALVSNEAPAADALTLGPLAGFPGVWRGNGFNLIEIPNRNLDPTAPPSPDKFRLVLNNTLETLTITEITGGIINRGNFQGDIEYLSLHYLQQVDDVNVPVGQSGRGIHLETGLFLNLPAGTDPAVQPAVARLGSIPHGDSLLAQGTYFTVQNTPPDFNFNRADPTPFTVENGVRVNDTNKDYLALLQNPEKVPDGIPKAAVMDPTIILEAALEGRTVTDMTVVFLDANPIKGVSNRNAINDSGAINNIPFVTRNANAVTFSAIFWLMNVINADKSTSTLLQYTQTIVLDFPVKGPTNGEIIDIKWPHIAVASLELVS